MSKNVKVFRCRICGDPYIGTEAPSRCPFCGAQTKYFTEATTWDTSEFEVNLSEKTRSNLEAALELEINNSGFYECAFKKAKAQGDEYYIAKFKALKKIELEHASVICKFLKIEVPALPDTSCNIDAAVNTKEGWGRENRAIKSYSTFRDVAVEPRIKEFFGALVEIETDHLELHAEKK
ncbi:MAG: ferritin [Methanosarcinaceae archaeon]|nr:ferritin [Methanosarcinaceae archaeon]